MIENFKMSYFYCVFEDSEKTFAITLRQKGEKIQIHKWR